MAEKTGIAWTDASFNIAWGCTKVSAGCTHCYAERDAKRYGHAVWGADAPRRTFGPKHWNDPLRWLRAWRKAGHGRPMRIFTSSMADVFEDHPTIAAEREKLWPLIRATAIPFPERATAEWLVVTKRPENFARFLPADWGAGYPNVMLLVTAEDQERADERVPILLSTPAARRGVSYEPALGPVDWDDIVIGRGSGSEQHIDALSMADDDAADDPDFGGACLDWIIVGGESGTGARPFDVSWARQAIAQCRAAGVACFVKQLGSRPAVGPIKHSPAVTGVWDGNSSLRDFGESYRVDGDGQWLRLRDRSGADPAEWPTDLRVREFPAVRA